MVSSVRPFDLMLGKILGVASVAVVQILIWGVLIVGLGSIVMPMIMPDDVMAGAEALRQGIPDAAVAGLDRDMLQAVAAVTDTGYIVRIFGCLLLFVFGGYLLYSAMFAAVGSAVDNVQDSQQLQLPITLPIIFSFIVMMTVMKDPNSPLAFWCSMIPFTSPIVMMARIPYDIPWWEVALSLAHLHVRQEADAQGDRPLDPLQMTVRGRPAAHPTFAGRRLRATARFRRPAPPCRAPLRSVTSGRPNRRPGTPSGSAATRSAPPPR